MLAKFPWEAFYHVLLSFSMKLIWKMSPRVLGKILAVLLTHWLPMASIMFKVMRICTSQFKSNYVKNETIFGHILFNLWIIYQILNILKENMMVIANVLPKLQTVKGFVRKLSQGHRFRTGFGSHHVKASQMLAKFQSERFNHVFSSFSGKLIWKMSPLVLCQILGLSVNIWTSDGKYPVQDCENLQRPIQMQLSENPKFFFSIFYSIS